MKLETEIREYREALRNEIQNETSQSDVEHLREIIFALDSLLGMFDTGTVKNKTEVFLLLQNSQLPSKDSSHLISNEAMKEACKWALSNS